MLEFRGQGAGFGAWGRRVWGLGLISGFKGYPNPNSFTSLCALLGFGPLFYLSLRSRAGVVFLKVLCVSRVLRFRVCVSGLQLVQELTSARAELP